MSLHIMYDHQCSNCEAFYIPYKENISCPNCGFEEESVNIISTIVNSANYQMDIYGCYSPIAWWVGSFGDHVALHIFNVLDKFYEQKEKNFEEVSKEYFDEGDWGDQIYLKQHIKDISYEVYQEIEKQK